MIIDLTGSEIFHIPSTEHRPYKCTPSTPQLSPPPIKKPSLHNDISSVVQRLSQLPAKLGLMKWYGAVEAHLHAFPTKAVDGGRWFHAPANLIPVNPPVCTEQEAGWVPQPVWTFGRREKSLTTVENRTAICQPAVATVAKSSYPLSKFIFYQPTVCLKSRQLSRHNF
jgi:hypothetical protein